MIDYVLKIRNKVTTKEIVVSYRAMTMDGMQRPLTTGEMRFDLEMANTDYLTHSRFILGIVGTVILRLNESCILDRIEIEQSANRLQLQVPNKLEFRPYVQQHDLLSRVAQAQSANGHQAVTVAIVTPFKLG